MIYIIKKSAVKHEHAAYELQYYLVANFKGKHFVGGCGCSDHGRNFVAKCGGTAWCKTNIFIRAMLI